MLEPEKQKKTLILVTFSCIALLATSFLIAEIFPDVIWKHYPVHSSIEVWGAATSIIVSVLLLTIYQRQDFKPEYFFAAVGMLGMGVFDGLHALYYAGNEFIALHSYATFFGGVAFSLIFFPVKKVSPQIVRYTPYLIFAFCLGFALLILPNTDLLLQMRDQNGFSSFARYLNISGGVGFILASYRFAFPPKQLVREPDWVFALLSALFGVSGLLFEFSQLWDINWWLWHGIRLIAYLIVLWTIFNFYNHLSGRLQTSLKN